MTSARLPGSLLRQRGEGNERVSFVELFFDLVFVFAITQLSHSLLEHLSLRGAAQTLLLLLAVWGAWVYTAWFSNWFDPEHRLVRLVLFAIMFGSLIVAAMVPEAFGDRGLVFAGAYAAIQVGRTLFIVLALGDEPDLRRNFQRILCWAGVGAVFWIAGGVAEGTAREALWLTAVLVDYAGPVYGFATPGLGRSTTRDWTIAGHHLAERFELFLILALGESILVIGGTFSDADLSAGVVAAFAVAFTGSVAFWWIYFDRTAEITAEAIAADDDPGRLGRSAYTYFHLPMVAGIIVAAVGDELTIAHPTGHTDTTNLATVLGGPALFLAGHALFKWTVFGRLSLPRLVAIVALAALVPVGHNVSPLAIAALALAVVVAVAGWDIVLYRRLGHVSIAEAGD